MSGDTAMFQRTEFMITPVFMRISVYTSFLMMLWLVRQTDCFAGLRKFALIRNACSGSRRGVCSGLPVNGCQETLFFGCESAVSDIGDVLSGVPSMRFGGV
jgi:hypothetical protein